MKNIIAVSIIQASNIKDRFEEYNQRKKNLRKRQLTLLACTLR